MNLNALFSYPKENLLEQVASTTLRAVVQIVQLVWNLFAQGLYSSLRAVFKLLHGEVKAHHQLQRQPLIGGALGESQPSPRNQAKGLSQQVERSSQNQSLVESTQRSINDADGVPEPVLPVATNRGMVQKAEEQEEGQIPLKTYILRSTIWFFNNFASAMDVVIRVRLKDPITDIKGHKTSVLFLRIHALDIPSLEGQEQTSVTLQQDGVQFKGGQKFLWRNACDQQIADVLVSQNLIETASLIEVPRLIREADYVREIPSAPEEGVKESQKDMVERLLRSESSGLSERRSSHASMIEIELNPYESGCHQVLYLSLSTPQREIIHQAVKGKVVVDLSVSFERDGFQIGGKQWVRYTEVSDIAQSGAFELWNAGFVKSARFVWNKYTATKESKSEKYAPLRTSRKDTEKGQGSRDLSKYSRTKD